MRAEGPRSVVKTQHLAHGRREIVEELHVLCNVETAEQEGSYGLSHEGVVGVPEKFGLVGGSEQREIRGGGGVKGKRAVDSVAARISAPKRGCACRTQ